MSKWVIALGFICALFLTPLAGSGAELTVSAAASLGNAFAEMAKAFEQKHPGLVVQTNYAASNPLLKQMREGAPVDVFASADQATMDQAQAAGLILSPSRKDFALNELALVVPKGHSAPANLAALANLRLLAIGNPDSVPAGRYARAALERDGIWPRLKDKFVFADNVRQALDYVARGEVDAGFVYATDARQKEEKVDTAFVIKTKEPVRYPIAVAVTGNNPKAGQEFVDFVLSGEGQAILAKYGFDKP